MRRFAETTVPIARSREGIKRKCETCVSSRPSMRTIIAGSRVATEVDVLRAIVACPWKEEITVVLSGHTRGADTEGERWALSNGLHIEYYKGPKRNARMVNRAEALIAVWDGSSSGTRDVVLRAQAALLRTFIWLF